jgi:hypothetical protein
MKKPFSINHFFVSENTSSSQAKRAGEEDQVQAKSYRHRLLRRKDPQRVKVSIRQVSKHSSIKHPEFELS